MKKIFYYLMCAVVAMGAMACQNDIDTDLTPNENGDEKVSFVAEVGDVTRVSIGKKDAVNGYPITLDTDDTLIVQLYNGGDLGGTPYTFTTTDGKNFVCATTGVSELLNQEVYVYYNHTFCSLCGIKGIDLNGRGTLSQDNKISLDVASPVLMFESDYDVTFNSQLTNNSEEGIFSFCDDHYTDDMKAFTIPASEGVHYIAVVGGVECTFSYSIDDVECKKLENYKFEGGKLYNLGTLDKPSAWNISGGHNEWSTTANPMYLEGNYFVARNVTLTEDGFQFNQGEWTKQVGAYQEYGKELDPVPVGEWYESKFNTDGYKSNITVTDISKKYDIYLLNSETMAYFYIAESGALPAFNSYALAGTFNDWSDTPMVATSTYGLFVAEDVTLAAYDEIKVKNATSWDESYGRGINNLEPNKFMTLSAGGGDNNIAVTTEGTYDIYFDYWGKKLYLVTANTDYTTATEQTENGPDKPYVEPELSENIIYVKICASWKESNAWFAAYFFGNGEAWVKLTPTEGATDTYQCAIPEGFVGKNVIFCRMNPGSQSTGWGNKWNQTIDIALPTDGKNLFTLEDDNLWDSNNPGGSWSVK